MSERTSHRQASMKKLNSKPKFLNLVNKDQSAQSTPRSAQNLPVNTLHDNKVLDEKAKVFCFTLRPEFLTVSVDGVQCCVHELVVETAQETEQELAELPAGHAGDVWRHGDLLDTFAE